MQADAGGAFVVPSKPPLADAYDKGTLRLPSLPLPPTRAQRGQMVTSLPAPSPSEAFFGLLSRHALIPHTEAVNKAEETSQRLRKEAGGSRVAVIGVVVRGASYQHPK